MYRKFVHSHELYTRDVYTDDYTVRGCVQEMCTQIGVMYRKCVHIHELCTVSSYEQEMCTHRGILYSICFHSKELCTRNMYTDRNCMKALLTKSGININKKCLQLSFNCEGQSQDKCFHPFQPPSACKRPKL